MSGIIEIKNAGIEFEDFAVRDVNLQIEGGMITAIEGHNGAGKSTLIKMILGMYPKMTGSITVDGLDVLKDRVKMLNKVGYVSEDRVFYREFSPMGNAKAYKKYYDNWDDEKYKDLLKRMDVSIHSKVGELSKGNYIRFQTAFALAACPKILILDEPTAGLDPVFRIDYIKLLQEIVAEEEVTVLIATHMTGDINKIADYVIDVRGGRCSIRENV